MRIKINANTNMNFKIADPYNFIYEPASESVLKSMGYEPEESDDYIDELFEDYGLKFVGWAIAKEEYYDILADNGEDIVCVGSDGKCYIAVGDRLTYASDWYSRIQSQYDDYDEEYDEEF